MPKKAKKPSQKHTKKTIFRKGRGFLSIFLLIFATTLGVVTGIFIADREFDIIVAKSLEGTSSGLPRIEITLSDVTLKDILSESKYEKYGISETKLIKDGEEISLGSGEFKGRGNSTWGQEKSPFQIKLDQKKDILGLGERKKWVLLANYFDDTVGLRNDFALKFAELLGEEFSAHGEFVELYINGEYVGLYYLIRKIEIDKNSVDVRGVEAVLAEHDALHGEWEESYYSDRGSLIVFKDAVSEKDEVLLSKAKASFMDKINRFEQAVLAKDFETAAEIVDLTSLAKYYLLNEFTVNPDGYISSYYFYTDGEDDKIYAGPGWDFDFSLGNRRWGWETTDSFYSPEETMLQREWAVQKSPMSEMIYQLMDYASFRTEIARIYRESISGNNEEVLAYYDEKVEEIRKATKSDRAIYPLTYTTSFDVAVEELRSYIERRLEYFEKIYGGYGDYGEFENYEILKNTSIKELEE